MDNAQSMTTGPAFCSNPYEVAEGCDGLVVMTEWNEFKQLDLPRIKESMKKPVLVDGRNIYDPAQMKALGFEYRGFGRGYNGSSKK